MVGLGPKRVARGWVELCKIPYKEVEQKKGRGNKYLKKGGASWVKGLVPLKGGGGLEPPYELWLDVNIDEEDQATPPKPK